MLDETRRMIGQLEEAVRRSGRSRPELESAMRLLPGTLDELFGGRVELEVRHLLLLARELGIDPMSFFRVGVTGGGSGDPILEEVERAFRDARAGRTRQPGGQGPPPAPDLDLDGAKKLVRDTIREELARLVRGEAAGSRDEAREGGPGPAGPAPPDD
jgi:hypothetical protein